MTIEAETCRSYEINVVVIHILCTLMVIWLAGTEVYVKAVCYEEHS